jgi:hypothetical protein
MRKAKPDTTGRAGEIVWRTHLLLCGNKMTWFTNTLTDFRLPVLLLFVVLFSTTARADWQSVGSAVGTVERRANGVIVRTTSIAQRIGFVEFVGIEKNRAVRVDDVPLKDFELDRESEHLRIKLENENAKEIVLLP